MKPIGTILQEAGINAECYEFSQAQYIHLMQWDTAEFAQRESTFGLNLSTGVCFGLSISYIIFYLQRHNNTNFAELWSDFFLHISDSNDIGPLLLRRTHIAQSEWQKTSNDSMGSFIKSELLRNNITSTYKGRLTLKGLQKSILPIDLITENKAGIYFLGQHYEQGGAHAIVLEVAPSQQRYSYMDPNFGLIVAQSQEAISRCISTTLRLHSRTVHKVCILEVPSTGLLGKVKRTGAMRRR